MIDRKGRIEAEDGRIELGKGRTGETCPKVFSFALGGL